MRSACSIGSFLPFLPLLTGVAGAQSTRLSGPLATPGLQDVTPDFLVSADGQWAALRGDLLADEVFELFVAGADGTPLAVRRNDPFVAGGEVVSFQLQGGRVLYLADQAVDERFELYSVPLDGSSAPVRLNGALASDADVQDFWPSPDGTTVLFAQSDPASALWRLYRVPADGSAAPVEIADSGAGSSTRFMDLAFSADGAIAAYRTRRLDLADQPRSLFRVPVDGSAAALELDVGSDNVSSFQLSADGSRVGFSQGTDPSPSAVYTRRTDGTGLLQLSTQPALQTKAIAADGSWLLFTQLFDMACASTDGSQLFLFPVNILGDTSVVVAPDEGHFLYTHNGLVSCPILGSGSTTLASSGAPAAFFTPDSADVVYFESDGMGLGLYRKPIGGGSATVLSAPSPGTLLYAVENGLVVLSRTAGGTTGFWKVPLDGSQAEEAIGPVLTAPHQLWSFRLTPDGEHVVYRADPRIDDVFELYGFPPTTARRPCGCTRAPRARRWSATWSSSPTAARRSASCTARTSASTRRSACSRRASTRTNLRRGSTSTRTSRA